ncbi:BTB domain-containing protein [Mycena chlorophos]|uniref:BTB domain-containing protein n=1 Tax=Mycena chlorophos TaxID=658473 RepID=A0A8H6S5P0_MYCCL|nr:BTB domain-containing protein [Mycena chlorophos]
MSNAHTLRQVDGLWFDLDGVILRAEDTVFRVSRSILAARSTVFCDMIAFPQPAAVGAADADSETLDGVPVVRIFDAPEDVEPFLRAIFNSNYFMPAPAPIKFLEVLSILRLSHKYGVEYLFRRALLHLEAVYPIEPESVRPPRKLFPNHLVYNEGDVDLDLRAIPILRQVDATWLLPFAFYSVGTYPMEEVLRSPFWAPMPDDLQRTVICLPMKHMRMLGKMHHCLDISSPICEDERRCGSAMAKFCRDSLLYWSPLCSEDECADPLLDDNELVERQWQDLLMNRVCTHCAVDISARRESDWMDSWEQLPANCGLERWDVLKQRRTVALGL